MNIQRSTDYYNQILTQFIVPFNGISFKRLSSDRDIVAEVRNEVNISTNGQGVTANIANFLTKSFLPSELIEETMLKELNKIFEPDSKFTLIDSQELPDQVWEIYLSELKKGKIALSQSGSGLKTVICTLAFLHLIPYKEKKKISEYIFGFEELENNLHPAVQRRLFTYLRNFALEHGCVFFITTHSNVVIDLFSKDSNAQIIHVTHDGEKANASKCTTYIEHKGILDDLDVRASDLLQSNCVVWVEGPSDRLYFNKWIEIWSEGKLREGNHYQCVFYGGRLLAHLSASDPSSNIEDLIKILKINRNSIIIMDSDKKDECEEINTTKSRVIKEINEIGGFSWVTDGKEIENYLPKEVFEKYYDKKDINQIKKFELIKDYLNSITEFEGDKFLNKKVLYAEYFIQYLTKDNISKVLDIEHKLDLVCDKIIKWNGIVD